MSLGRVATSLLAMALVLGSAPVAGAQTDEGFVLLPTASPGFARTLHDVESLNGLTGYVMRRDAAAQEGRRYTLTKTEGSALVALDVYFYEDINSMASCRPSESEDDGNGGETGHILCEARWAVVVLLSGFDAEFRLNW